MQTARLIPIQTFLTEQQVQALHTLTDFVCSDYRSQHGRSRSVICHLSGGDLKKAAWIVTCVETLNDAASRAMLTRSEQVEP